MLFRSIEPKLSFVSVEGKEAVSGLIKRMINYNQQVSDSMQLTAPLLYAYSDIVKGRVKPNNAVEHIENAIQEVYKLDEF